MSSSFSFAQCNKIISQELNGFSPNPVDKLNWSYDTLSITNLSNCDIRVRPQFSISHESLPLVINDFNLQWFNPFTSNWDDIIYTIDLNGNAVGYFSVISNDTTGIPMSQQETRVVNTRVRFNNNANYGLHSAIWTTNEVDISGNFLQVLSTDSTSISLANCSSFQADSSYTINTTNISCFGSNDGSAIINMLGGATPPGTTSILSYCSSNPNPNFSAQAQTIIEEVQLTGDNFDFNNNTAGMQDFYEDYTSTMYADLSEGNNYTVNVIANDLSVSPGSYAPESINVYIDFNIDGDFLDAGEDLGAINIPWGNWVPGTTYSINFIVPTTGVFGPTRMRVVCISNAGQGSSIGPCESPSGTDSPWFGATEDYSIVLNAPTISATYEWENGSTLDSITSLAPGTYSVTITNNESGCEIQDSIIITEPNEITFSLTSNSSTINLCNGSVYATNIIGGCAPYNYLWDDSQNQTTDTAINLCLGTYCLEITDCNGCKGSSCITVSQQCTFNTTINTNDVSCYGSNNGYATITPNGGISPYSYNWSDGQDSATATNLYSGIYNVIITDSLGCVAVVDSIIINEPIELTSSYTQTNVSCFGGNDGSALVNFFGGTTGTTVGDTNYILGWGGIFVALPYPLDYLNTASLPYQIPAGIYPYSVTDLNGCSIYDTIIITEPDDLFAMYATSNYNGFEISCHGYSDGEININFYGGTGPFENYLNGILQQNWLSTNLTAGSYINEVIDANGCTTNPDTIILQEPLPIVPVLMLENISCNGLCDGQISVSTSGGIAPYSYSWNNSSNSNYLDSLCSGNYTLYITDYNNCNHNISGTIIEPQPITSTLTIDSILCYNDSSQVEINIFGGTQPFTFNWSNGSNNYYTTFSSGNHSIQASDINGCIITDSFTILNPDSIISINNTTNTNCFGGNDGSVFINVISGGNPSYSYSIDNGVNYQISNIFNNLTAGNYTFLISDINGCLSSTSAIIMEPDEITSNTNAIDVSCYGYCDGSVSIISSGGTPPYSYFWSNGNNNLCAGFYNVTITDSNNCIAINSAIINEPNPILVNIWIEGDSIVATSGFTSYQWYFSDGTQISGATSNIFEPSTIGEYYVVVTDNNCEISSYTIDYNISGWEIQKKEIKIYPNPTNGYINVEGFNLINSVTIINYLGNQLLRVENKDNNKVITKIDLSNFAKGVYFMQIEQKKELTSFKITLQ